MRRMVGVVGCVACRRRRVSSDLGRSSFRTVFVRPFWSGSSDREKVAYFGGERGIRTLEGLLTLTPCYERLLSSSNSPVWYLRVDSRIRTS